VVVPDDVRHAIAEHARAEAPNEACGLLVMRDGLAERYEPGRNVAASPYRFELQVDPELWFLEDDGYELAIVHSHPEEAPTGARPSRTDVENIGLWEGRPYLVYSLADGGLRAYRIAAGEVSDVTLT
jgi:[CysO sulfur-carrier protein]-S-L-cysteine hydrolase